MQKYWGYTAFRPLQADIINSVLAGNDTLALLPTGGGKSICYQVPALAKDGICIVISPLISLIKDQVETLRSNGIIAVSVHSGLHKREIDIALDYCVYGKPKFLFVSPERLETELFRVRVQKMKVNLIAIDEAHCISQWGYDFRPSYLKISNIRNLLPHVPVLALTATATPNVVEDIKEKLAFKNSQTFFQTFERNNLVYVCRKTDNKIEELKNICSKLKGTGIVYVRNRRRTQELAAELQKSHISAGFYHAGLPSTEREKAQTDWKKDNTRIIVAT
ncbi:MAG TPA: RecQ family ATP-dependent DNA helicase, partial [Flavobacteriales bacterium]|nr:RecQ family ATP-dependent DNA helicase [Flavobacteriales bacterium]